jgi:hypothetical protein
LVLFAVPQESPGPVRRELNVTIAEGDHSATIFPELSANYATTALAGIRQNAEVHAEAIAEPPRRLHWQVVLSSVTKHDQ